MNGHINIHKNMSEEDGRKFMKTIRKFMNDPDNNYIFEDMGDLPLELRRRRPYSGQSHTDHGKRGETVVSGLTMRDIGDCIARGFAQAKDPDRDDRDFSDGAVIQNGMVNIEKMMGIYPKP